MPLTTGSIVAATLDRRRDWRQGFVTCGEARIRVVASTETLGSDAVPDAETDAPSQPPAEAPAQSWTRRMLSAVGGLVLATGVVGTAISAYFQWRGWDYQAQSEKIAKDSEAAANALEALDKILDEKFLSTYDMDDAIKTKLEGRDADDTITRFYRDNQNWEQQHAILSATLKIAVDSQFGLEPPPIVPEGVDLDCTQYLLKYQQPKGDEPLSVRNLLEIAYSCHDTLKNRIDAQVKAYKEAKAAGGHWPETAAEPDPGRKIIGHIWRLDNLLQCMMVERVLELRHETPEVPFVPVVEQPRPYRITDGERIEEERCVAPYRSDRTFGIASLKPT